MSGEEFDTDTPPDPLPEPQDRAKLELVRENQEKLSLRMTQLEQRLATVEDDPMRRLVGKFFDYLRAFFREADARPSLSEPAPPRSGGSRPPRT